jgi:serine/threonine protein kinase/TolB-like protein/tetratricopeptide (TPR) repeat protein
MDRPPDPEKDGTGWWDRLDRLVEEACALPPSERDAFLNRVCAGDPAMRAEASSLLAHADSGEDVLSAIAASLLPQRGAVIEEFAGFDPLIGRQIHQYAIEARLGSGGMGVVYRALDTRLGRPVALKFIWPHLNEDATGRKRLLIEAQAAAALDHPNVCTVYEVGESPEGGLFIAMGYYEGETLKAKLARGPLSIQEAVDAIRQVAEGVRAAHARGIIHCDIKPGNILVTRDGVAKLLDFGIAKQGNVSLAGYDRAAGTRAYMSPEQFRGEPVDARSDIWSLGVVAYELMASRRPFQADTPTGTMQAVLNESPPPLAVSRDGMSAALEGIIQRALAKSPEGRQQSVAEFVREVEEALAGRVGSPEAHSLRKPPRRRLPAGWSRQRATILLGTGVALLGSSTLLSRPTDTAAAGDEPPTARMATTALATSEPAGAAVAVLRFEELGATGQSWFTDGITEAIQAEIRQTEGLRVVGHFSSLALREVPPEEALFGSRSGGHYLLTGGVRRSGDSIWVTPRLVEAATGVALWETTYGRAFTPEALSEIPKAVAREAARTLAIRLPTPSGPTDVMPDPATYESYLEGRYHLRRFQSGVAMTGEELDRSVSYLREVVARDPAWAPGHAALGEALSWVGMFESEQGQLDAAFSEARDVLEHALRLDPADARAHATLGYVLHRKDLDFAASEARFRRALELDPDQYWHCGYGFFLLWSGRYEEAAQVYRRAEVQDPLYLTLKDFLAASYLCTGRYDEAIATSLTVLAQIPQMAPVRRSLVLALQASGREDEAFARIDQATQPNHPYWDLLRALLHARSGRRVEAESLLRGLDEAAVTSAMREAFPARQLSPAPLYAAVLVALDRREEAIRMLDSALARDPGVLLYDRCYPELMRLEDDVRYRALLRRSGVPI